MQATGRGLTVDGGGLEARETGPAGRVAPVDAIGAAVAAVSAAAIDRAALRRLEARQPAEPAPIVRVLAGVAQKSPAAILGDARLGLRLMFGEAAGERLYRDLTAELRPCR